MNEEISRILRDRFPILERLSVQVSAGMEQESMPRYLGIILSVMNSSLTGPVCFVFPRRGDMGRLSAILYGISNLSLKFPQLAAEYARMTFQVGQRVRVKPGGEVYVYDGIKDKGEIWLRVLQETWGRRRFPLDEILRLEPTERKRPIGRMEGTLRNPPASPLDAIIGKITFGNQAIIQNELLILDSQGEFENFVERTVIQSRPPVRAMVPLGQLLPFGDVRQPVKDGDPWFNKWERLNPVGEPLVAVTYSPETLANYCIDVPARTKLLVINGIDQFKNHLQAYDEMSQTQKMVLFADHEDIEMVEDLRQRGCCFWWFDDFELLETGSVRRPGGMISRVEQWSHNQKQFRLQSVNCNDQWLQEAHKILYGLSSTFLASENEPLMQAVAFCWKIFGESRGMFRIPTPEEKQRVLDKIKDFRRGIQGNRSWISTESFKALDEFVQYISVCYGPDHNLGENKGRALLEVIKRIIHTDKKIVLLVRSEDKVNQLREWLDQNGVTEDIKVHSMGTLPMNEDFDHMVCVAWPGAAEMQKITARFCTPHITVVCYPFEGLWLKQFIARFHNQPRQQLTSDEKAAFITDVSRVVVKWPDQESESKPATSDGFDLDMWILEYRLRSARIGLAARPTEATETVMARYVRFMGESYAFLTDSHKLPVVTDLLSHRDGRHRAPAEKTIMEIKTGDFVVFPESGDRELIEELADKLLGESAVKYREKARLWKRALQNSGLTQEQFFKEAQALQRPRHIVTIHNWFTKASQIGPQDRDDLTLVACVTNDRKLMDEVDGVQEAINVLRGAHLSAGMRLRDVLVQKLSDVIGSMKEGQNGVDMGELGSAVIVQVEHIDDNVELRGRNEINHLLSDD